MRKLINKRSFSVIFLFLVIEFLQFLKKLGINANEDGWRKASRVYLRTEESKFILACFGLNFLSELEPKEKQDLDSKKSLIIKELIEFFRHQPTVHWQLQWNRFSAKRIKKSRIDIVHASFNENGNLKFIIPYLDLSENNTKIGDIDDKLKNILTQEIIESYNKTKDLDDKIRPLVLKKQLDKSLLAHSEEIPEEIQKQARSYIEKILSATFICFETTPPDYVRFEAPDFIKRKHPGFGFLNTICRLSDKNNEADLWIQCSHICGDGVPIQEVLQELKAKFGSHSSIKFPTASANKAVTAKLCSTNDNSKGVYTMSLFVNIYPFLKIVKEINKQHVNGIKTTPLRFLIWRLGNHPVFSGKKFLIPIDLPRYHNRERTLGFVLIRPSIYFNRNKPGEGLHEFQQEFSRQVKAALARRSESYELLESYALLPPIMYSISLKTMPSAVKEFIGSIGVTIINQANLFIAPFSDVHTDGFIAFSNFFTPTDDGDKVCYINIKGPKGKVIDYLTAIEEMVKV